MAAAEIAGLDEIYRIGGAQAVAALALGTERVQPVDLVAGPGNVFVQLAKQMLAGTLLLVALRFAIDLIQGRNGKKV